MTEPKLSVNNFRPGIDFPSLITLRKNWEKGKRGGQRREKKSERGKKKKKTPQTVRLKSRTFEGEHKHRLDINHHFALFQASSLNFRHSTI